MSVAQLWNSMGAARPIFDWRAYERGTFIVLHTAKHERLALKAQLIVTGSYKATDRTQ